MLGDPRGAVLVDSGYCTHKEQTLSLVRATLAPGDALRLIVNTHLHSDHCGGNAHLAAHFDCPIWIPPGHYDAVLDWRDEVLSYVQTGQQCERFVPTRALLPGEVFEQTGRQWQVHAAPGHDPHSLILFEPDSGVLMSADALWEHGFGIVFPEIDGAGGFDEVEQTLDVIAALPVRVVVPGHGPAFTDVAAALAEARSRLDFFRRHPERHTRHAAKALLVYHMLEVGRATRAELTNWLDRTPIHRAMWQRHFADTPLDDWSERLLGDLAQGGTLKLEGDTISCR
jgi:glyoxylase-like metal-dependent hydrolase (beta-lactamase superfamily II)